MAVLEDVKEPKEEGRRGKTGYKSTVEYADLISESILGRIPEPRRRWFFGQNFWGLWQRRQKFRKATG